MPWKECKPMDERLKFIARLLEGEKQGALKLKMQFDVPLSSGPATVKVRGRLMYFALISADVAAFGVRFQSVSREGVEILQSVISAALEPG